MFQLSRFKTSCFPLRCPVCHARQPDHLLFTVQSSKKIITCNNCNSSLYLKDLCSGIENIVITLGYGLIMFLLMGLALLITGWIHTYIDNLFLASNLTVALAVAVPLGVNCWVVYAVHSRTNELTRYHPKCEQCQYPLDSVQGDVCPECGRAFDRKSADFTGKVKRLRLLPSCPVCDGKIDWRNLLAMDIRHVFDCEHCRTPLQLNPRMTMLDYMFLLFVYVGALTLSSLVFAALLWQMEWMSFYTNLTWVMTAIMVGWVFWRVMMSRIQRWLPTCPRCCVHQLDVREMSCDGCGKTVDRQIFDKQPIRLGSFIAQWIVGSAICFVSLLAMGLVFSNTLEGQIREVGLPWPFVGLAYESVGLNAWQALPYFDGQSLLKDVLLCLAVGWFYAWQVCKLQMHVRRQRSLRKMAG